MTRIPMISATISDTVLIKKARAGRQIPIWRRLLAGLTAGAVAVLVVLSSTLQVRADENNRDLVSAMAAIVVTGVTANRYGQARSVGHDLDDWYAPSPHYTKPQRGSRIPGICAIEIEGRDQTYAVVYTESCLREHGINRLPDRCAREIRFYGRKDYIYSEPCLREAGFRIGNGGRPTHERPD